MMDGDATLQSVLADLAGPAGARRAVRFSVWDLVGQTAFYDMLHALLTHYAVCLDMEDMLADPADCLAYIKFWLNAIHLHAAGAPGTHTKTVFASSRSTSASPRRYSA